MRTLFRRPGPLHERDYRGRLRLKKDRFVRIDTAGTDVGWGLVERARQLAGFKGYVTNLPAATMDGHAVVGAYHDLWQVEKSFRMAKSDARGRFSTTGASPSRPT